MSSSRCPVPVAMLVVLRSDHRTRERGWAGVRAGANAVGAASLSSSMINVDNRPSIAKTRRLRKPCGRRPPGRVVGDMRSAARAAAAHFETAPALPALAGVDGLDAPAGLGAGTGVPGST